MNRPSERSFSSCQTDQNQNWRENPVHSNGPSPRTGVLDPSSNPSPDPRRSLRLGGLHTLQHRCEAKGVTTGLNAATPLSRWSEQVWLIRVKGSCTKRETLARAQRGRSE